MPVCLYRVLFVFQFTHPGRGATLLLSLELLLLEVSIHAPREGCDRVCARLLFISLSFNSRTPGGVRLRTTDCTLRALSFNSRTPGGVRRDEIRAEMREISFQFTHPGRGATRTDLRHHPQQRRFNSRTPGGVQPDSQLFIL